MKCSVFMMTNKLFEDKTFIRSYLVITELRNLAGTMKLGKLRKLQLFSRNELVVIHDGLFNILVKRRALSLNSHKYGTCRDHSGMRLTCESSLMFVT